MVLKYLRPLSDGNADSSVKPNLEERIFLTF